MLKFSTKKKAKKTGCVSVSVVVGATVGHYIKQIKSTL